MADGIDFAEWGQTSQILAAIANSNRDSKRKSTPYKAIDYNPFKARIQQIERRSALKGTFRDLASIYNLKDQREELLKKSAESGL